MKTLRRTALILFLLSLLLLAVSCGKPRDSGSDPKLLPVTVTELPSVEGKLYVGQPLSTLTLSGGKASVDGIFRFKDADATLKESGSYELLFTPTDSAYETVTEKITLTAEQLTVTVKVGENGLASHTGTVKVDYGSTLRLVFTPNIGYAVASLTLDGESITAASTYTFSNITESHTLAATFGESELSLSITCLSGSENAYTVAGSTLTFTTLSADSVYAISGELAGNIVIDVGDDYKFELEMIGLSLVSTQASPIEILSGDKVTLVAKKDTVNTLVDRREVIDENDEAVHSAAIYSAVDLDVAGKGALTVTSENGNGIHTKDDLSVKNLTLSVTCRDNCLKGNDSVTLTDCALTLIAKAGDGIKTSNTDISEKGKQKGVITISGVTAEIYAACDGVDAAYDLVIEGDGTSLSVYTDQYSSHSEEVSPDTDDSESGSVRYLRFNNQSVKYAVKYYNSDTDYKWVNATFFKSVSDGRSSYYYHSFPILDYEKLQVFVYTSDQMQGQEEDYYMATDFISWNDAYDTLAFSVRGNQASMNWTNYSATVQPGGGMGGFPGGGPGGMGGMQEGNSNKGDYSTKGLKADNEIVITGGSITVKSYDDALHAGSDTTLENGKTPTGNITVSGGKLTLYSDDDGIHADGKLLVTDGIIEITGCYEGLEGSTVEIAGGDVSVISSDDGVNATATSGATITVSGGKLYVYAKGDGLDSNSSTSYGGILFSGGEAIIICQSGGNSAIDSERGYQYTGGKIFAIASSGGMSHENTNCQNFSSVATQRSMSFTKDKTVTVTVDGETVISFTCPVTMSGTGIYLGDTNATITVK